jgi:hypothetical protein
MCVPLAFSGIPRRREAGKSKPFMSGKRQVAAAQKSFVEKGTNLDLVRGCC